MEGDMSEMQEQFPTWLTTSTDSDYVRRQLIDFGR